MAKFKLTFLFGVIFTFAICFNTAAQKFSYLIKRSTDGRYLVDQNNKPFAILGRTAWFLMSQPVNKFQKFIDNTVAHGYNSIEISVLTHDARAQHPPFNGNGNQPFLKTLAGVEWKGSLIYTDTTKEAPDTITPNEIFWKHIDTLLSYCMSKNVLVFLFPAYVGYNGNEQGWMQELVANGPERSKVYGQWIANRYKNQKNIVWMLLGDMGRGFTHSDHSYWEIWLDSPEKNRNYVWATFLNGNQVVFIDPFAIHYSRQSRNKFDSSINRISRVPNPRWDNVRDNMGYVLSYSRGMNLAKVLPRHELTSAKYCLAHVVAKGSEYLVYSPTGGSFIVDLSAMPSDRKLAVEWFNPATGTTTQSPVAAGSKTHQFDPPFCVDAVLYLVDTAGHQ